MGFAKRTQYNLLLWKSGGMKCKEEHLKREKHTPTPALSTMNVYPFICEKEFTYIQKYNFRPYMELVQNIDGNSLGVLKQTIPLQKSGKTNK